MSLWRDLGLNLISKAVGIVATVFIIDKVLAYRERQPWKAVQSLVLQSTERPLAKILSGWRDWLLAVSTGSSFTMPSEAVEHLRLRHLQMPNAALVSRVTQRLGNPIGSQIEQFAGSCTESEIDSLQADLTSYLSERPLQASSPAWTQLIDAVARPVNRISKLIDEYSSVVSIEPEFALPAIRLSYDLENLKLEEYQLDAIDERLEVASMLSEAIIQSIRLRAYLRRHDIDYWLRR